jgi:hypothetical protein
MKPWRRIVLFVSVFVAPIVAVVVAVAPDTLSSMLYLGLVVLSLASCVGGFASQVVNGNICHIENGRTPNAGAAIFPSVPLFPVIYVLMAWVINRSYSGIGYCAVALYSVVSIGVQWRSYFRSRAKLNALKKRVRGVAA